MDTGLPPRRSGQKPSQPCTLSQYLHTTYKHTHTHTHTRTHTHTHTHTHTLGGPFSILQDTAVAFNLTGVREVCVRKVDQREVGLDLVELSFKDQYITRSDMWRITCSLVRVCMSPSAPIISCRHYIPPLENPSMCCTFPYPIQARSIG